MSARKPRRSRTGPGQYSIEEQRERMIQHRHELQLFAGCGRTLEDSLWQCLPSSGAGHGKAGVHGAGAPRSPLTLVQAYGICTADGTWLNSIQEEGDQVKIASQASKSGNYAYVFQVWPCWRPRPDVPRVLPCLSVSGRGLVGVMWRAPWVLMWLEEHTHAVFHGLGRAGGGCGELGPGSQTRTQGRWRLVHGETPKYPRSCRLMIILRALCFTPCPSCLRMACCYPTPVQHP